MQHAYGMQLKCAVIDKEQWAFELIKKFINRFSFLQMDQTEFDPVLANHLLQAEKIDLLFVDIEMAIGNQAIGKLINKSITIFTTSYKKYAFEGFEFGALDYLLKPVDFERFTKAVCRAFELFKFMQYARHADEEFLIVRSEYKTIKIPVNEIEYLEGFANYIRIYTVNEKPLLSHMTLKAALQKLPQEKFKRIHKSYVISMSHIMLVKNNKAILVSNKELPISRGYKLFGKE